MSGTQRAETTHAARPRHTPPCTGRGSPRWESRRRSMATEAAHPPRTPPCRRRRWRKRASAGRSVCRTSTRGTWVHGRAACGDDGACERRWPACVARACGVHVACQQRCRACTSCSGRSPPWQSTTCRTPRAASRASAAAPSRRPTGRWRCRGCAFWRARRGLLARRRRAARRAQEGWQSATLGRHHTKRSLGSYENPFVGGIRQPHHARIDAWTPRGARL